MKVWIELEGEEELQAFLRWRRNVAAKDARAAELSAIDERHGRTEIAGLGWPAALVAVVRAAGVETVEQARAMTDTEWLKTPKCGRKHLHTLRGLLAAPEAP